MHKVLIINIETDEKTDNAKIEIITGIKVGDEVVGHDHIDLVDNMAVCCEALVSLIKGADKEDVRPIPESLYACFNHVIKGVFKLE